MKMKFGPQPTPNDYRIFKGSPTQFFDKVEREFREHEKEEAAERDRAILAAHGVDFHAIREHAKQREEGRCLTRETNTANGQVGS